MEKDGYIYAPGTGPNSSPTGSDTGANNGVIYAPRSSSGYGYGGFAAGNTFTSMTPPMPPSNHSNGSVNMSRGSAMIHWNTANANMPMHNFNELPPAVQNNWMGWGSHSGHVFNAPNPPAKKVCQAPGCPKTNDNIKTIKEQDLCQECCLKHDAEAAKKKFDEL